MKRDICAELRDIRRGEKVVYYSGLTPRSMDRPEEFRLAGEMYNEGRVNLVQKLIVREPEHMHLSFQVGTYDYIAVGR